MFICFLPVFYDLRIVNSTDEVICAGQTANNHGVRSMVAFLIIFTRCLSLFSPAAVCDSGAHAGADVQTQDIQPQPQRLPQNLPLPEMAEDGGTAR